MTLDEIEHGIALAVRRRRVLLGMTQKQIADQLGVGHQLIHKYETGEAKVSGARLWQLAQALGVSVSYFFPDEVQLSHAA